MPQIFRQMMMWWWVIGLAMLALMFGGNWRRDATTPLAQSQGALPALGANINATDENENEKFS